MNTHFLCAAAALALSIGATADVAIGSSASRREASGMYDEMRRMALELKASDLQLTEGGNHAYGIVMDIDINGETATLTSFSTGDASLYLSTGGGTIGGIGHENIASAAKRFVQAAEANRSPMTPANGFSRPKSGQVTFYVLTPNGVISATRSEEELGEGAADLSALFYAGQEVLTAIRENQER